MRPGGRGAGRGGAGQGRPRAARPHREPAAHTRSGAATSSASPRIRSSPPSWRWPTSRASRAPGVAACVKHLVANDQEHDRFEVSSEPDERTLREVSLLPFEHALRRAGAWSTMAAYNRLHGTHCSQHERLLTTILRDEWGWDGVVDLRLVRRARHRRTGPRRPRPRDARTAAALGRRPGRGGRRGRGAGRGDRREAGAAGAPRRSAPVPTGRRPATRRPAARRWPSRWPARRRPRRSCCCATRACCRCRRTCGAIAVVGPNGDREVIQGGGSARVTPTDVATVADGLRERLGAGVTVEPGVDRQPRDAGDAGRRPAARRRHAGRRRRDRRRRRRGAGTAAAPRLPGDVPRRSRRRRLGRLVGAGVGVVPAAGERAAPLQGRRPTARRRSPSTARRSATRSS